MVNFWKLVNNVIRDADVLLLVLDARFPVRSRNKELEQKITNQEKKLIYVINKCDLVTGKDIREISKKFDPSVFVSSKKKLGGTLLFKEIMKQAGGKPSVVGVIGYPNVGKSSVINLLKGKKSASVSSYSGHTRGVQFISAKGKLKLIDTPGVLEFKEKDLYKQILMGSINPQHIKEPDYFASLLIQDYPKLFEKYFKMEHNDDAFEFLEEIALKRNILKKGGEPDLMRFGRTILQDWQTGKIHDNYVDLNPKK